MQAYRCDVTGKYVDGEPVRQVKAQLTKGVRLTISAEQEREKNMFVDADIGPEVAAKIKAAIAALGAEIEGGAKK